MSDKIDALLASPNCYDIGNIPTLDSFLTAQVQGKEDYHFDSIRTLVKLHALQTTPMQSCMAHYEAACWLALTSAFGKTDLVALLYLIPIKYVSENSKSQILPLILKCHQKLQACEFASFWETYGQLQSKVSPSLKPLSDRSIGTLQRSILSVLRWTYQEAPMAVVQKALNNDTSLLSSENELVAKVEGDVVFFTPCPENTKKGETATAAASDEIQYDAICSLLSKVAAQ